MNTEAIKKILDPLADSAIKGCGSNDLLYADCFTRNVNDWIDAGLRDMDPSDISQIMEMARPLGYDTTPMPDNCCSHGFTDDCPCGCFDDDREIEQWQDEKMAEWAMEAFEREMAEHVS